MPHLHFLTIQLESEIAPAISWLLAGFVTLLIAALSRRLAQGVKLAELWRTRFYELRPVRGLIVVVWLALWSVLLGMGVETARLIGAWFENQDWLHFGRILGGLATLACAWVLTSCWRAGFVAVGENRRPSVRISGLTLHPGIEREAFDTLGIEHFPNVVCPRQQAELRQRKWLLVLVVAVIVVAALGDTHDRSWWYLACTSPLWLLQETLSWCPNAMGVALAPASALAGIVLLWKNGSYSLLSFRQSLLASALCIVGLLSGLAMCAIPVPALACAFAAATVAMGARWIRDLWVARRYRKVKAVYESIAANLRSAGVPLTEMKGRTDCQLAPMSESELVARISNGCRNAEGKDPLVMRNFGRFLRLVDVSHEMTTVAMLRFLTVGRWVGEHCGGGTTRGIQDPSVPEWNESLFPLCPPAGFVNWLDPLGLDASWDRVCWCGNCGGTGRANCTGCGGTGRISRQENGRTVTSNCMGCGGTGKVVCASCSGLGRLVFGRTLNTQWKRFLPAHTEPNAPLPELFEDAEERVYYRSAILEARVQVGDGFGSETDGIAPELHARLDKIAEANKAAHSPLAELVSSLHDARHVYRADFQVTGFWTLRIGCRWLRGRVGWFFGKRPEFYFPCLPLSWSFVGTVALLVPLTLFLLPMWVAFLKIFIIQLMPAVSR